MAKFELTLQEELYLARLKSQGVNPIAHLEELISFENYVYEQFPQINEEAWSAVLDDEEEIEDDEE